MKVTEILKQYIDTAHPQYQQVTDLLWQYLLQSAVESVPESEQDIINKAILTTAHTTKLTNQETLQVCYPDFYAHIDSHIKKFFADYV